MSKLRKLTGPAASLCVSPSALGLLKEYTRFCRLYVAPADAPMGHLDILPNTPKLWQSLAHELVRPVLAQMLRVLPICGAAVSDVLRIHRLSLSVLDGHLEHVLGRNWSVGTSAVKYHINQVCDCVPVSSEKSAAGASNVRYSSCSRDEMRLHTPARARSTEEAMRWSSMHSTCMYHDESAR